MDKIENQESELRAQKIAQRIATLLNEQALNVDAKTASKLNYARQQAVANMAMPSSRAVVSQNGVLQLFGDYWHQHRFLMMLLMCGLCLVGLLTIQNIANQDISEQSDAYLLASDLPPEAYLNEGFGTWLSENTQQ